MQNTIQKEADVTILTADKIDLKTRGLPERRRQISVYEFSLSTTRPLAKIRQGKENLI